MSQDAKIFVFVQLAEKRLEVALIRWNGQQYKQKCPAVYWVSLSPFKARH